MNTYTMKEIKQALKRTHPYMGGSFDGAYQWLRNELVQRRRNDLIRMKKDKPITHIYSCLQEKEGK